MRIERKGSSADHGTFYIDLGNPAAEWDSENKCIKISARNILNFYGPAHHDYEILISLNLVHRILKILIGVLFKK